MDILTNPENWVAFATLVVLEIVLGIDNIVFLSILAGKLPKEQQARARLVGLGLAVITRVALLFSLSLLMQLQEPWFYISKHPFSGRDLILIAGGLFLVGKSTYEIHHRLEGEQGHTDTAKHPSFTSVIIQILILDIVFSLDSVITAVGMSGKIPIMVAAVLVSVVFMMFFAGTVSEFVDRHPTVKMLALSFLLLIGVTLLAEGFNNHIPKGYIYFSMAFSMFVETLNLRARKTTKTPPVKLREPYEKEEARLS